MPNANRRNETPWGGLSANSGGALQGSAQILLAALLWSSAGLLIRGVPCAAGWLLVMRSGAACLALLPSWRHLPQEFWRRAWPAALCYALFLIAFVAATRLAGAAQAVAGQYTAPLFVYAVLVWKKQIRIRVGNVLPMAMIAGGSLVALIGEGASFLTFLPLSCGVLFPLYSALLRRAGAVPASAVMCLGNFFCVLLALPFTYGVQLPSLRGGIMIAVAGVLVNAFAYTMYTRGVRLTAPLTGMMLCLAEPILNPVWVWLFLGEKPTWNTAVSLSLILLGGVLDVFVSLMRARKAGS